jgi:hypothetical protein
MTAKEYAQKTAQGMSNLTLEEQNECIKYIIQELLRFRECEIKKIESQSEEIRKSTETLRRHLKI